MLATLPVSRLINVSVNLAPAAAQSQNLSALLILGSSTVIDVVQRLRAYSTIAQVATDFGTNAPEYLAANLWFQQNPQPNNLFIGRFAQAASAGQLLGAPLVAPNNLLATWQAIANGSFKIQIDALAQQSLVGLNFTAAVSFANIATIINAVLVGAVVSYDAVNNRFIVTSNTTGAASVVSFAAAGVGGTDVSGKLGFLATNAGSYQAPGIVAETAVAATTIFDQLFGQQWYGLTIVSPGLVNADHLAVAGYIEASSTFHFYGVTTQDASTLTGNAASTGGVLQAALFNKTAVQYSSASPYAVASLLARILTTDWAGNKTAITLMYKQEPGIAAENLNSTQIAALEGLNVNVFTQYNNSTAIIEKGVACSGQFIDTVIGTAAFAVGVQTAIYNTLFLSSTKIPQSDTGMSIIATAIEQVCAQFEVNGLLAPGVWTAGGFGALNTNDFLPKGYYVYVAPVATQSASARGARIGGPFQVAAKLAGAVHTVSVLLSVNA